MTTQLFASIKKSSKYHYQNEIAKDRADEFGLPFPVSIADDPCGYVVRGGPGSQYTLEDVQLFVLIGGKHKRLA